MYKTEKEFKIRIKMKDGKKMIKTIKLNLEEVDQIELIYPEK